MIFLSRLWHVITDSWRAPRRARVLYLLFAAGFVTMAVAGAIKGDALVVALGVIFAVVTASIALLAPRLAPLFAPPAREQETLHD